MDVLKKTYNLERRKYLGTYVQSLGGPVWELKTLAESFLKELGKLLCF